MSVENFNKTLPADVLEAGFDKPTPIQLQTLSVINSGADVFAVAPAGGGKSIAVLVAVIKRLKTPVEGAPRALILVDDNDKAKEMERLFKRFTRSSHLRCECLCENGDVHNQVEAVLEGTDALIATPKRLHMLFLKNWINLTRLQLVVLDDAHLLLKHGHKVALDRLGISLHKCQRLAFTEEFNEKVASLTVNLMPFAKVVEVNGEQ